MTFSAEISGLVGVTIGAILSFTATFISERANWRRNQGVRWDERRLTAYSDYSYAVKDMVALAGAIAAGKGLDTSYEPLDPSQENLAKLAESARRRTIVAETLRLLTDAETMAAAGQMTQCAAELEWLARGRNQGNTLDWNRIYRRYEKARDQYITCARKSLKVTGSHMLPEAVPRFDAAPVDDGITTLSVSGSLAVSPDQKP